MSRNYKNDFNLETVAPPSDNSDTDDYLTMRHINGFYSNKDIYSTEAQADASTAVSELTQIMQLEKYNGVWRPNWNDAYQDKYVIKYFRVGVFSDVSNDIAYFLAFRTKKKCDLFLHNKHNFERIKKASPIIFGINF